MKAYIKVMADVDDTTALETLIAANPDAYAWGTIIITADDVPHLVLSDKSVVNILADEA